MNNKEKQLLLIDLCGRLPYGVKVKDDMGRIYTLTIGNSDIIDLFYDNCDYVEAPIMLYLRPMSSMTKEEKSQYNFYLTRIEFAYDTSLLIDWLNANHFDFRNLIERELAIAVTEENNPYKD